MNYLAHLYFSGKNEEILLGNFIADFLKNRDLHRYGPGVLKGIYLHREIDAFTDQHPIFKNGNKRLHKIHRKYAGVVNDILYDHLLFLNWGQITDEHFTDFETRIYDSLTNHLSLVPKKKQHVVASMIDQKWLRQYTTIQGMRDVFRRMQHRVPKDANFTDAMDTFLASKAFFLRDFDQFFPDCDAFVKNKLDQFNLQNEV